MRLQFYLRSYFVTLTLLSIFCCWMGTPYIWNTTNNKYGGIDFYPYGLTRITFQRDPDHLWAGFQFNGNIYPYAIIFPRKGDLPRIQIPPC